MTLSDLAKYSKTRSIARRVVSAIAELLVFDPLDIKLDSLTPTVFFQKVKVNVWTIAIAPLT